jgi:hypothetical protein
VDAFDRAGFEPLVLDDLEAGRHHQREVAAGEVFTRGADREPLEQPLCGVDRWPGAADVVEQQQLSAGGEDSSHLVDRRGGVGDGAQRQGADNMC